MGSGVASLVIAWSRTQPERIGECASFQDDSEKLVGRGSVDADDPLPRVRFYRRRPGASESRPPLEGAGLAVRHLRVRRRAADLEIACIGRSPVQVNGSPAARGVLRPGDTVLCGEELLLVCVGRQPTIAPLSNPHSGVLFPFGIPDPYGLIGESPAAWALRDQVVFAARGTGHVLLLGPKGAGKELAARNVHALSSRQDKPLVLCRTSTLPASLTDVDLFGQAKDCPTLGMAERRGRFGLADGGTLFLDEIGELSAALSAHLLRVLDDRGEYQRLGDPTRRRADVRLVAATSRADSDLPHDVAARFKLRVRVPGLGERREDIPLLAVHLLRRAADEDARLGARFFDGWGGRKPAPRLAPALVDRLVRHAYTLHVRELDALLRSAMASSTGTFVALTKEVEERLGEGPAGAPSTNQHKVVRAK